MSVVPKMKILFVCKYNRFRSRVAEAYFNKINKNPRNKAKSGGIIVGSYPLDKKEVAIAKELGIILKGKPEPITTEKLIWQDVVIIVADNVPKKIFKFNRKKFGKKVIVWRIPDIKNGENGQRIREIIQMIKKKVDGLVGELR